MKFEREVKFGGFRLSTNEKFTFHSPCHATSSTNSGQTSKNNKETKQLQSISDQSEKRISYTYNNFPSSLKSRRPEILVWIMEEFRCFCRHNVEMNCSNNGTYKTQRTE
jgi:hypothetical protein